MGKFLWNAILVVGLLNAIPVNAQSLGYVKQVITVNSGTFEYSPPYSDYVNVQTYNPISGSVSPFNTIFTQSGQAAVISNQTAFIAAQDSIIKFNLNTLERTGAIRDSGICQLAVIGGKLIVSKQYPITSHFVEVLDTASLSVIAEVTGISGDCGGITRVNDTVYVAVNGGWMGTNGKLAIIDTSDWTLKSEIDFGTDAIGIFNLYTHNNKVFSVNKTPYGAPDVGSITMFDPSDRSFTNTLLPHIIGSGAGVNDNLLYMIMDYGIGSFNLNTLAVQDSVVIPDPGSSVFTYITSAAIDTLDNRIYTNTGNYVTGGTCLVSSLAGDSITSYATGISSDAIAIDYRTYPTSTRGEISQAKSVTVFPNPVNDKLNVSLPLNLINGKVYVMDATGRVTLSVDVRDLTSGNLSIPCQSLAPGFYFLIIESSGCSWKNSFIKK